MNTTFEEIRELSRELSRGEKAALAHILIKELDSPADEDVERLWIEEAERRLDNYRRGEIQAIPGDEAMARARELVK